MRRTSIKIILQMHFLLGVLGATCQFSLFGDQAQTSVAEKATPGKTAESIEKIFEPETFFSSMPAMTRSSPKGTEANYRKYVCGIGEWLVANTNPNHDRVVDPISIEWVSIGNFDKIKSLHDNLQVMQINEKIDSSEMALSMLRIKSSSNTEMRVTGLLRIRDRATAQKAELVRVERRFRYSDGEWKQTAMSFEIVAVDRDGS